jgi:hypothetical protein
MVTLVPKHGFGIVVLANLGPTNMPQALTYSLVDHLIGLPARDWNSDLLAAVKRHEAEDEQRKKDRDAKRARQSKPTLDLAAYAGRYRAPAYGVLEVFHTGQGLRVECLTQSAALEHYQYDTFRARNGTAAEAHPLEGEDAVFQLDAEGSVASVKFLNTEFRRLK